MNDEQLTIFQEEYRFIFQNYNLVPIFKMFMKTLSFGRVRWRYRRSEIGDEVVTMLGLEDKLKKYAQIIFPAVSNREWRLQEHWLLSLQLCWPMNLQVTLTLETSADVLGLLQRTSREFDQTLVMITHNNAIKQLALIVL